MRFAKPPTEAPGPNIAPLLDVVLLLLIFFVVTSSFAEREIALELPSAEASERPIERELVVNVLADGRILVDDEQLELDQLEARLARTAEEDGSLEIRADGSARHADVVGVLDRARRMGVLRVGIATDATGSTTEGAAGNTPGNPTGSEAGRTTESTTE